MCLEYPQEFKLVWRGAWNWELVFYGISLWWVLMGCQGWGVTTPSSFFSLVLGPSGHMSMQWGEVRADFKTSGACFETAKVSGQSSALSCRDCLAPRQKARVSRRGDLTGSCAGPREGTAS